MAYDPSDDDDHADTGFRRMQTALHEKPLKSHPEDLYEPVALGSPADDE